jgi:glycosyltransferase involved in cell wall biosynthesis
MQRDTFAVDDFPSLERFRSEYRGSVIRVCIATEEITGPVRNGGIASTYYHLARGLAREGHKVTVLYLKGRKVENETPEHWITHFAQFDIELVYLDLIDQPLLASSERWQRVYYSFYLWLKQNERFEVIHTSEWRGGAFYCLQAKKLGLAFQNMLFVVKTSSPHIWNRHYQMQPIDEPDMIAGSFAEQRCVEWADMVVGGSAHLLSFMKHIGYNLPLARTYVQPNIMDFSEVIVRDERPPRQFGDVVTTDEVVFFGRLEPRKGLEIFVNAINILLNRGIQPSRVSFLGKEGERLPNSSGMKPLELIAANARRWPFPVDVVTDKNQPEALSFMCQREMLAVMPSLIENSTMAVYEALVHKIPFIATQVGGTPELIEESFHRHCLIPPNAELLSKEIERVLTSGQPIAEPAFDNDKNLETWYGFHRFIAEHGPLAVQSGQISVATTPPLAISYVVYVATVAIAHRLIERLADSASAQLHEVIVCVPFVVDDEQRVSMEEAAPGHVHFLYGVGLSIGDAFNRARALTSGDVLIFDAVGSLRFSNKFVANLRRAINCSPASIFTSAVECVEPAGDESTRQRATLFLPVGGDLAAQYATGTGYGLELIALRTDVYDNLGPFEDYNLSSGIVHEYVSRGLLAGVEFEVIPEPDIRYEGLLNPLPWRTPNYDYMKTRGLIDLVSLPLKRILLFYLSDSKKGRIGRTTPRLIANAGRSGEEVAWLSNASEHLAHIENDRDRPSLVIGFNPTKSVLRICMFGWGSLRITANREEVHFEIDVGGHLGVSERTFDMLQLLESQERVWLKIEFNGHDRAHQRWVALQKVQDGVFFLSGGRSPILWGAAFDAALSRMQRQTSPARAINSRASNPIAADGAAQYQWPSRGPKGARFVKTRREERVLTAASDEEIASLIAEAEKVLAEGFATSPTSQKHIDDA